MIWHFETFFGSHKMRDVALLFFVERFLAFRPKVQRAEITQFVSYFNRIYAKKYAHCFIVNFVI